ncbi:MAG: SdpI family protein [Pseudomonadales bacterium]|nr:SdpI family protein [Pseudomonadales bacterium]
MSFIKAYRLSLFALSSIVLLTAVLYSSAPEMIPSRFDINGEVAHELPKAVMAPLIPAIYFGSVLLLHLLILTSPQKFSVPNSKRPMDVILFGVGVLLGCIQFAILLNPGDQAFFNLGFTIGVAAFLIIAGNVWGKTERNFFAGIRIPWTIATEENWRATHRLAGKLMVIFGLLLILSSIFTPNMMFTVALLVGSQLIPMAYSLFYFWRFERSGST